MAMLNVEPKEKQDWRDSSRLPDIVMRQDLGHPGVFYFGWHTVFLDSKGLFDSLLFLIMLKCSEACNAFSFVFSGLEKGLIKQTCPTA